MIHHFGSIQHYGSLFGRLAQHNSGRYLRSSTKGAIDWELFLCIECDDRSQALKFEQFIKRMKEDEELVNSLLARFTE